MSVDAEVEAIRAARANPYAWAQYVAGDSLRPARHLRFLARKLLQVHRGEIRRLWVSMPPGHAKSQLISRFFPAWWLGTRPKNRYILVSMSRELTLDWSTAARNDLAAYGSEVFGVTTWTRASASRWSLFGAEPPHERLGGSLVAVGIGGTITGRRANVVGIDDVMRDDEQASNEAEREKQWKWLLKVALTRLLPGGAVVACQTRWHDDDLPGRLKARQEKKSYRGARWEFLNLPAIADSEDDPMGRAIGEPLWPEMFSLETLAEIREEVGPHTWTCLYQGQPTPDGGGFFQRPWFKYYDRKGDLLVAADGAMDNVTTLRRFVTVDLASSKKSSADYSVFCLFGVSGDRVYLLDLFRARLEGPEIVPALERFIEAGGASVVFIEAMGAQLGVIQQARKDGLPAREMWPSGDKVSRALPATAALESGKLLLPREAAWLPELERELLQFPNGKHDDQVDAVSYGVLVFNKLRRAQSKARAGYQKRGDGGSPGGRGGGRGRGWKIGR